MKSEFPFIKMITPSSLVGYRDEFSKKDYLHKVFTDAYKSPLSILILGMTFFFYLESPHITDMSQMTLNV